MAFNDKGAERAYKARWYRENRTRILAERKVYQAARREELSTYHKEWRRRNPERSAALARKSCLNYRARLRDVFVESVDPAVVFERDSGRCGICGGPVEHSKFHVDHIKPLYVGGDHSYANVQLAHPACNLRKGASWTAHASMP